MIFYKVYEDDFKCGEYNGDTEVKYYISKTLAEEDINKRRDEWPTCPVKIEGIRTVD